jgi:hypothetical protein
LFGTTVITHHVVHAGTRDYEYLVVVGRLSTTAPLAPRVEVAPLHPIGRTGTAPAYFEVRRLRSNVDVWTVPADHLRDPAISIAIDARNVLGLK